MRQKLQEPFDAVLVLARQAGDSIMDLYRGEDFSRVQLDDKSDASPLTLADLASNRCICEGLARLTPAVPVVTEEDPDSLGHRNAQGQFWLIDPLDGTKEFLARNDEFTVNIALIDHGLPVWGVVYAPALDEMYWGGAGLGAWRQAASRTESIHVATRTAPGRPKRVVASKSHLNEATRDFIAGLGAHELVQAGSSLKFCRIAEGAADVYPRMGPTCEWDTAAAQAVVEGAGGQVQEINGARLRYGKPDVLNPHFVASAAGLGAL